MKSKTSSFHLLVTVIALLVLSLEFFFSTPFFAALRALKNNQEIMTESSVLVLNVLDFGAKGDNRTDDTLALRKALTHAAALQTNATTTTATVTILVPKKHTFPTGPLNLTSGITLQIDGTLRALNWKTTDWPIIPPLINYGTSEDARFKTQYQSFLYARNAQNIQIIGQGTVDGGGPAWWDSFTNRDGQLNAGRPNLVQLVNCTNVEIASVTPKDSPFWCLHPTLCEHVHIHHIKIRSHMYAPNSDGIDPDSSKHVLIENNDVSCGDDHIAIKAGLCGSHILDCDKDANFRNGTYETLNVTIRNNLFRTGMGIALGSECSGGIRNITIENNLVGVCQPGHCETGCCGWSPGLHLKTTNTRGGHMENILFRNNTVYNTSSVILVETDYQHHGGDNPTLIKNLTFQSNKGKGTAKGISFQCSPQLPCEEVSFVDNEFHPTRIGCKNVRVVDENGTNLCADEMSDIDNGIDGEIIYEKTY